MSDYTAKLPTWGSADDRDPVWLLENTSTPHIAEMLELLVNALDSRSTRPGHGSLFSYTEKQLITSIKETFENRLRRGFDDRPLSAKQLYWVVRYYKRLGHDTAMLIDRVAKDT